MTSHLPKAKPQILLISLLLISALAFLTLSTGWQNPPSPVEIQEKKAEKWVDSVFLSLDETEKIGQLICVRAHSDLGPDHEQEVREAIQKFKVGSLCFFQGGPYRQARLSNDYQSLARVPLMISIDGEWGLGMRLDTTMSFPHQMTLGALQNDSLIYQMGQEIAYQFRRLGIHVNYAPVVDINSTPENPVIHDRSFGEKRELVTRKALAYMQGMQAGGLIANAKHFPGHGDTNADSHFTLPTIKKSLAELEKEELYPFRALIKAQVQSVMVAHLNIPALDNKARRPSTLSPPIVQGILREQLGFEGLIFTDALEMRGVADYYSPGSIAVQALAAGNDVLLLPGDLNLVYSAIRQALKTGKLSWEVLDQKIKRVLKAKYFAGLNQRPRVALENLHQDLHQLKAKALQRELYAQSLTVLQNKAKTLPFKNLKDLQFVSVALGSSSKTPFQDKLDFYASVRHYQIPHGIYPYPYRKVLEEIKPGETVLLSLQDLSLKAKDNFGLTWQVRDFIDKLQAQNRVVLSVFGSPYALKFFATVPHLICAYEDNEITQDLVPELLFGARAAQGKLPVSVQNAFSFGEGIEWKSQNSLGFALPEAVAMNTQVLSKVDSIFQAAQSIKASPGGQLVVARRGKIIWNKAYGYHSYEQKRKVEPEDIYDVASITKVSATLALITQLYDQGKINLDAPIQEYLPELKGQDKGNIKVREVLCHQAGLVAYIPFWEKTVNKERKTFNPAFYRLHKSPDYPFMVTENLYAHKDIEEKMWNWAMESKRREKPRRQSYYRYEYSDLSFYILKRIAERLTKMPMEDYVQQEFYQALGMSHSRFNPLDVFPPSQIPPTENDQLFRHQLIQGTVHDQGAAMLGGVGGHAGLFSNALDLAKYMQMQMQGGSYAGKKYFSQATTRLFQSPQYPNNRRGLGWDRKDEGRYSYMPDFGSEQAFGHSGFTGCVVWADPKDELVIVFLSNRIHPSAENTQLITEHIRRKVLNQVYKARVKP